MNDMIESMKRRELTVAIARDDIETGIAEGHYQFLFMSPETLLLDKNWNLCHRLVTVVVD